VESRFARRKMMRKTRWLILAVVLVAVAGGLAGWGHLARAYAAPAAAGTGVLPVQPRDGDANPIIAVLAGNTETEYEQDPFETTRLRKAVARVRTLVYVHQDGTVETKDIR
jgi:hypothetical protein